MVAKSRPIAVTPRPLPCPHCGRHVTAKHFYKSGKTRCRNRYTWTAAKRFRLMTLLEQGKSDGQIAKAFGTTPDAINLARKRYGIPSRHLSTLSAREVARRMGVGCAKTVVKWIDAGFLVAHRGHGFGGRPMWYVRELDLIAFIEDERTWHTWTTERITDPALRRVAIKAGRPAVRYLSVGEVADRMCVQIGTVNQWIRKGQLAARKWGNWFIDERDLDAFELPRIGGWNRKAA